MENSLPIELDEPKQVRDAFEVIGGSRSGPRGIPASLAWRIEARAAAWGWPIGRLIGTEADLMREFSAGRETLREAIRILQGRGSVKTTRGRTGGLVVARPDFDRAASVLTLYLRTIGCTLPDVAVVLDELEGSGSCGGDFLFPLCEAVQAGLAVIGEAGNEVCDPQPRSQRTAADSSGELRALALAAALTPELQNDPQRRLGTEADLSERYRTSAETVRQALRILSDLDLLETRKGRAGGAFPKQPQPIGVIRQFFAFFAARQIDEASFRSSIAALNHVHLRLAMVRLGNLPEGERKALRAATEARLIGASEPMRFVLLQEAIGRIAANALVDTLLRCVVAYRVRITPQRAMSPAIDSAHLCLQRGLIDALFALRQAEADELHGAAHRLLGLH